MKALLLLAVSAALAAQTPIEAKTILVIGDSISAGYGIQRDQGWVALLESRVAALHPPHKVVNASISGDTTGGALARLPRTLEVHKPDVVIIELGGNDALRGYPVERIENNLDAMAGLAKDAGASVVVLAWRSRRTTARGTRRLSMRSTPTSRNAPVPRSCRFCSMALQRTTR
jgi:acyl-CoA thioesterase-1